MSKHPESSRVACLRPLLDQGATPLALTSGTWQERHCWIGTMNAKTRDNSGVAECWRGLRMWGVLLLVFVMLWVARRSGSLCAPCEIYAAKTLLRCFRYRRHCCFWNPQVVLSWTEWLDAVRWQRLWGLRGIREIVKEIEGATQAKGSVESGGWWR